MSVVACGEAVPPYCSPYIRTLLDDADAPTARTTLDIILTEFSPLLLTERSTDPSKPAEGHMVLWMSDGTGFGDDGDLIVAATAGGVTRRAVLWDFSAAASWLDGFLLLETGDYFLLESGDKLILE
ncbi:MAG: hypothetical protein U9N87_04355 [Planctomycetota bacterium]|nr:hypothetical protein [Planctomycetota bacterium]